MGKVVKGVASVVGAIVGVAVKPVLSLFKWLKVPKPSATAATTQRLNKQLEPEAFRKIVFGETAAASDLRYWEVYGASANNYVEVIAAATHKVESYGNLYLGDTLVPFSGTAATGQLAGALSRYTVTQGVSGGGVALGGHGAWTVAAAMTGCSYYVLDYLYSQEKFPQGIQSRYTQVIKGAPVYDPRRDVAYGGTHVITDQTTWAYSTLDSNSKPIGRNNALQMLWYQLGWRINGKLVAGKGVDPADIDLASFIQAANDCELMGWYSDCILSTGDTHESNEGVLEAAAQGNLLDPGGRFSYFVAVNDTANIAVDLTEDDVVGDGYDWNPRDPLSGFYNEIAGTYISAASLYQPAPFPLVYDNAYYTADGRKQRTTESLSAVQDVAQAQKLMRIKLNKTRFQGEFTATFNYKAMKAQNWSIVRYSSLEMGWVNKVFRVVAYGLSAMDGIDMTLREESASIYTGGTIVTPPAPSAGYASDPYLEIAVGTITATATGVIGGAGTAVDVIQLSYATPHPLTLRTEYRYRKTGDTADTTGIIPKTVSNPVFEPLQPTTNYTFNIRHVSVYGIPGPWASVSKTTNAVTVTPAGMLVYADGTPVEALKPAEAGANVTATHTAAGITGQSVWATYATMVPGQVVQPGANLLFDGGLKLRAQNWSLGASWLWDSDAGLGGYIYTSVNGVLGFSARFSVKASNTYTAQVMAYYNGSTPSSMPTFRIAWYDASDTFLSQSTATNITSSGVSTRFTATGASPGTAAYARISFFSGTLGGGGSVVVSKVKLEIGSVASVFSDDATSGALYANGVNIDTLKPGELGANVTETRTAAALLGQGALATLNQATWATQVTGVGKPSDYANVSLVYRQTTAPTGSITVNDIWVQVVGITPVAIYAWNGSAWQTSSDITSLNTSVAIVGQGALATQNTVTSTLLASGAVVVSRRFEWWPPADTPNTGSNWPYKSPYNYTDHNTSSVPTDMITIAQTFSGSELEIECVLHFPLQGYIVGGANQILVSLLKDGSLVQSWKHSAVFNIWTSFRETVFDTPSAGSHTYTMTIAEGGAHCYVGYRAIIMKDNVGGYNIDTSGGSA